MCAVQENALTEGAEVNGFRITAVVPIEEMNACGIYAVHRKTGCGVFHVRNADPENLFAFAFSTPPEDSRGTAHILEHAVLCGSQQFPLKDPFIVLSGRSVKTFLNAMTYPDKTVFPASSVVEADYFHLLSVYGDAVFFPLLEEWTFLQEGRRFELYPDGSLAVQGVVFNEMKGNYSSFDSVAGDWTVRCLFEGTPYAYDSGGEPACIPDLTYEEFRAFHARHYHPSNCRIFLYGNIATEKQLEFLDCRFLSRFSRAEILPDPPLPARWTEPKAVRRPAPAGDADCGPGCVSVSVNWLLPETADPEAFMTACLIEEILLGHDGAPLAEALLNSGLGDDILPSNGLETDMRQMSFSAGLRNVRGENAAAVERVVMDTLERLVRQGIPDSVLRTSVHSMDFLNREIRRGSGPFSLVLMSRALRGWMRGRQPWETMRYIPVFARLKEKAAADPSVLTDFIRTHFLENPHRCLLSVYPDEAWGEKLEAELAEKTSRFAAAAGLEDTAVRGAFLAAQEKFREQQLTPDPPEVLARIPHLPLAELPPVQDELPSSLRTFGAGAVLQSHPQEVNGIAYADFFFPVDTLPPEDYALLPFFASAFSNTGLSFPEGGGMTWAEAASAAAGIFGGLGFSLYVSSPVEGARLPPPFAPEDAGRDFLVFRIKMLEELSEEAVSFALDILRAADFSDGKRIATLFSEYKNDMESSVVSAGNQYAASRVSAGASRARAVDELWNGLAQIRFLRRLAADPDARKALPGRLQTLQKAVTSGGVFVHLTGTASGLERLSACVQEKMKGWPGFSRPHPETRRAEPFFRLTEAPPLPLSAPEIPAREHVYSEMQIGFAAAAVPAPPYPGRENAAMTVLGHWLANGPLWESVRTTGGAYGVFAYPDVLERVFVFSSYRDPDPSRSLDAFAAAVEQAASRTLSGEETGAMITGCYSREIRPKSPSGAAFTDCIRMLFGITPEVRRIKRRHLLSLSPQDLRDAAVLLRDAMPGRLETLLGPEKIIKRAESGDSCGTIRNFTL